MTFREKLEKEHPEKLNPKRRCGCNGCPADYGYEPTDYGKKCAEISCADCWDREIPGTEEKENKPMKKTKAMLEEELEQKRTEIEDLKKELEKAEKYKQYDDAAGEMKAMYDSFVNAGFNDDRAFTAMGTGCMMSSEEIRKAIERANPKILDSGNRRQFESGAVRDIQEGKGRCDLLPLDVVADINGCGEISHIFNSIAQFQEDGVSWHLAEAVSTFAEVHYGNSEYTMFLEVSKHFEEGAKKYGENNWQKGIPVHCYIDSAVRHYLKFLRGDKDEPHDRAFCWNIMCAIWTCKHKPELNEYRVKEEGAEWLL